MRIHRFCFLVTLIIFIATLITCVSSPRKNLFENSVTKSYSNEKDYDKVWQEIINFFAENEIKIQTQDKSLGNISSSGQNITRKQAMKWSDCKLLGDDNPNLVGTHINYQISFEVVVKKQLDDSTVSIVINQSFLKTWKVGISTEMGICNSLGVLEAMFLDAIK